MACCIDKRRLSYTRLALCIAALLALGLADPSSLTSAAAPDESPPAAGEAQVAVPAYRQANQVAVLRVEGIIDRITLASLERRFEQAQRDGATAIVLDIHTPGGELNATLDICHLLKTDAPPNTVAWINHQAYSAGTIIALAAREIVVQENASFGDAAPIAAPLGMLIEMSPAERAKLESPILEEVVDSARRHHYDEKLVQAFVSVGVELWLVEHNETGERIFVDRAEYQTIFDEEPPQQMTAVTPRAPEAEGERVRPWIEQFIGRGQERDGGDAVGEIEFHQQLPSPRRELTEADRGTYQLIQQVISADRLLTVRANDALYYGLATEVIRNDQELMAYFGAQSLVRYDQNWSESLARFMMSTPVRAILIVVFLVALFIELAAPGVGVFGATAAVALLLFLGAPALVGMAQWWGILLVILGLGLLAVEIFVIPGLGVAGVLGLVSLFIGLVGAFVTGDITTTEGQNQLWVGAATTITAMFAAGVIMWLISRQVHSFPILDRLILKSELGHHQQTAAGRAVLESAGTEPQLEAGDLGVAHTALRPAGRGRFGDRIVDVQSLGGFIDEGTPVRIVSVGRYVIDVEEATE